MLKDLHFSSRTRSLFDWKHAVAHASPALRFAAKGLQQVQAVNFACFVLSRPCAMEEERVPTAHPIYTPSFEIDTE